MLNYIIYRIGQFLALSLPLKMAYAVAVFISDVRYAFAGKDKRIVTENLKAIFPELPDEKIKQIRLHVFRNFAKYLVDFFRFSVINKQYIAEKIKLDNIRIFDRALKKDKGVIVVTGHIGNWELGGVVIAALDYPFWVVALKHKHPKVNDFFDSQRESKGMKVIPFGNAVRQCLRALRQNQMVALVADRNFGERGVLIELFGKKVSFPEGPAALALKTGSPIVPGFMTRNKDNTFTLKIEEPIEINPSGDYKKDAAAIMERYKTVLEDYIRKYPDQWYMFKKFWGENKS